MESKEQQAGGDSRQTWSSERCTTQHSLWLISMDEPEMYATSPGSPFANVCLFNYACAMGVQCSLWAAAEHQQHKLH